MKNIIALIGTGILLSCSAQNGKTQSKNLSNLNRAYFASGCFWCVEAIFESVKGVEEAVSGYAGGNEQNPSYQQVSAGKTGHTETVVVYYDSTQIDYKTLLKVFYGSHNPTTVNGQHPDYGTQYRSAIFYTSKYQKTLAVSFKDSLDNSGSYAEKIATEISPLKRFWEAEEYHQDYEKTNPNQPYVRAVSIPRLNRFKEKFPELLK
ncbi:peptide-methionine (S)-S-oxide reductase MsrA [Luteibaculum oceani]|uniref:Peptide methionine sulfoxide reductase MsrA n=1 Tax=Luteibaculum oceani TaxID=1294296 RepID=A0A5C6V1R7_9FLAO|nr:peptide-methionine (S)-S-oxide reductase MsrA [Luteibaculum oceani]TXC78631.1 peptide-methionine (S)-S-oxide reductase MsrA [Luteibaculum oceani]